MNKLVLATFSFLLTMMLTGCTNKPLYQPEGTIKDDSHTYIMMPTGYKWDEGNVEINTISSHEFSELAELFETLDVEAQSVLKFDITKNPSSISVTKYNEDGTSDVIETKENELPMPAKSGYYIFEIKAKWPEGKINFVFDVHVR